MKFRDIVRYRILSWQSFRQRQTMKKGQRDISASSVVSTCEGSWTTNGIWDIAWPYGLGNTLNKRTYRQRTTTYLWDLPIHIKSGWVIFKLFSRNLFSETFPQSHTADHGTIQWKVPFILVQVYKITQPKFIRQLSPHIYFNKIQTTMHIYLSLSLSSTCSCLYMFM